MYKYYPEDFKEEVREMLADGLTVSNVAWYLGVSKYVVGYIRDPESCRKRIRRHHFKNREHRCLVMREYNKKYRTQAYRDELRRQRLEWITPSL